MVIIQYYILFWVLYASVQAQQVTLCPNNNCISLSGQQAFFYQPYDIVSYSSVESYMNINLAHWSSLPSTNLSIYKILQQDLLLDGNNPIPQTTQFCRYMGPNVSTIANKTSVALLSKDKCGSYKRSSQLLIDLFSAGFVAAVFQTLTGNISSNIIVARADDIDYNSQPMPLPVILLSDTDFNLLNNNNQINIQYMSSLNESNIRTAFYISSCQVKMLCVVSPILFGLVLIYGLGILVVLTNSYINAKPAQRVAVRYWLASTGCLTVAGLLRMTANIAECTNHSWGGYVLLHISTGLIIIAYVITLISWLHTVFIKMTGRQTLIAIISTVIIVTILSVLQCVGFIIGADMPLAIIMATLACLISIAMTLVSGRNYIYFLQSRSSIRKTSQRTELSRRILVPLVVSTVVTIVVVLLTSLSFSPALDLCAGAVVGTILYFVVSVWPLLFITWIYVVYIVRGNVVSGRSSKASVATTTDTTKSSTEKEVEMDNLEKKDLPQ